MSTLTILSAVRSPRDRAERLLGAMTPWGSRGGGDRAVLGSMKRGLRQAQVDFDLNPRGRPAPTVIVQSGLSALEQAIKWKSEDRIRRLLAGPNLVVRPGDHPSITDPRIDVCIVPSDWVKTAYADDAPELADRLRVWAAGVDTTYWSPGPRPDPGHVVVYQKTEEAALCTNVQKVVEAHGLPAVVTRYGSYRRRAFRSLLQGATFAVFLSRSESQGVALAETWAMDVPTFVWEPGELVAHGRRYSEVSSAPYLSAETGARWTTLAELASLIDAPSWHACTPRAWVLENLTDRIAAARLLELARG